MTWDERCHEAAAMFERGENDAALAVFEELASDESADKFGRAMMYVNIATIEAKLGSKIRVVKAYERAAGMALYAYVHVQSRRVEWLFENGHTQDAIQVLEKMLAMSELTPEDRAACEQNLRTVKKHGA